MKQISIILWNLVLAISLAACGINDAQPPAAISSVVLNVPIMQSTDVSSEQASISPENTPEAPKADTASHMQIAIGNTSFSATLAKNAAVDALIEMLHNAPIVINMRDYSGFEKVGPLGTKLPTDNNSITTGEGDIVLYNANQIVVFYGAHSWDYTRLGKIDDLSKWKETLGDGDVTITFSIK